MSDADIKYLRVAVEVTRPLPAIRLPDGYSGIGLCVRRNDEPVSFILHRTEPGANLEPWALAQLIVEHSGVDLVRAAMPISALPNPALAPCITIAICTKDRAWSVARCLDSLEPLRRRQNTEELRFELLIVDNAPSDGSTRELAMSREGIQYAVEPKAGLNFARNKAVQTAQGDYLAFLDDDVVVDTSWLDGLERAIQENPDAGAFTGPVLPFELESEAQVLFEERGGFTHGFATTRFTQHTIRSVTYPCNAGLFGAGCNMTFRRDLLIELGLFDEALDTGRPLPGGGDLDMFYRVLRSNHPLVYERRMVVYHQHRREYDRLRHQMWTWGLGYMAYVVKSYRADPEMRGRFRLLIMGAFAFFGRMAFQSYRGRYRHPWHADLALAELKGAIQGLAGEYDRSRRRTDSIRAQCS